jgi:competence protein ComEC
MFAHRPALRFVMLYIAGILVAEWFDVSPFTSFIITVLLVIFSVVLILIRKEIIARSLLLLTVILLGCTLHTINRKNNSNSELNPISENQSIKIFGFVDSEPEIRDHKIHCIVRVDSSYNSGKMIRDSRRVMATIRLMKEAKEQLHIEYRERIVLQGIIEPFPFQRNPGEFDYGRYLILNDIQGVITVYGLNNVLLGELVERQSWNQYVFIVQKKLFRIIENLHNARHASFIKGIIFGNRSDIPRDVKQSFMDTGTIHILAVSGSNVAFVAFMFFAVFGFLRLPKRGVVLLTIVGLVFYMLVTGSSPSVVRATIMAIVILVGTSIERRVDIYNSVSIAALILLLWNTNTLFDVGFQLSFAAVLSIIFFYPRLENLIERIQNRFDELKVMNPVLKLFAVSLAAQIGTIPFTAYYFGRISIISLIANIFVVPLSGLITYVGFAEVLSSVICKGIASLYATVNDFLVWFLLGFVKQAASVSFAYVELWKVNIAIIAAYYGVVIASCTLKKRAIVFYLIVFSLLTCNYYVYQRIWMKNNSNLRITAIDVGQGDAILIETPQKKNILIDAGPASLNNNSGNRIIVPLLKHTGIANLNDIIITHLHNDHIGGLESIVKSISVGSIIYPTFINSLTHLPEIIRLRWSSTNSGSQIQIDSTIRIYVFHPSRQATSSGNMNNTSIVIKVVYGKTSILFNGDAEAEVEHKLIQRYKNILTSDIFKVAHHGSATSSSEEFLKAVKPQYAIISVGKNNRFSHPSPMIIKRLRSHKIAVHRTDYSGAIVFESDGENWHLINWRR